MRALPSPSPAPPPPPLLCRTASRAPGAPDRDAAGTPDEDDEGRLIRCGACGRPVAAPAARTGVGGRHAHVFANPAGLVFEVGCFREAFGCRGEGPFVAAFSWFGGFAWQVAVCRGCEAHLGWRYRPRDGSGPGFWGLILARLAED